MRSTYNPIPKIVLHRNMLSRSGVNHPRTITPKLRPVPLLLLLWFPSMDRREKGSGAHLPLFVATAFRSKYGLAGCCC
uniref:Uncharacterized protein n=1 Tax=Solanum lycopersicum TaxID=4081 RepID=A0A3Q7EXP6_SOLLC